MDAYIFATFVANSNDLFVVIDMMYIVIKAKATDWLSEILQAELADLGFDSFMETEDGFEGSVEKTAFQKEATEALIESYNSDQVVSYTFEEVAKQNWNKLWESNFHPIEINEDCYIRASFHAPVEGYKHQLVITPKMSFGTGHHATTSLMIQQQLKQDHEGKAVFDIGCGTAVLAVMAKLLGASVVDACDIEDWSVENALENAEANDVTLDHVYQGTVEEMQGEGKYDLILANINLNVHKASFHEYVRLLKPEGKLLLSGFYETDIPTLEGLAQQNELEPHAQQVLNNWTCLVYTKK